VKGRNPDARVNPHFPFGEDIDLVPPNGSPPRHPDIEGQDYSANLGSDEKESPSANLGSDEKNLHVLHLNGSLGRH
jgi:hypothetical protein